MNKNPRVIMIFWKILKKSCQHWQQINKYLYMSGFCLTINVNILECFTSWWFWANKRAGIAEALAAVGLIEGRRVTVECYSGVARHLLDALEDLAGQDLADVALAELRALGVVVLVQLKLEI